MTCFGQCLALAGTPPAPCEPEPVRAVLDEYGYRYPGEEVRYPRARQDDTDEEPTDHPATRDEVKLYLSYLEMLARRASTAACDRRERNFAGHAREELRKGKKWLAIGEKEEAKRGFVPPRTNPISIARTIAPRRVEKCAKATSAYQIALDEMHHGARYALAVLNQHGIDPMREPVEDERPKKPAR
jgi:hypothetical protein